MDTRYKGGMIASGTKTCIHCKKVNDALAITCKRCGKPFGMRPKFNPEK